MSTETTYDSYYTSMAIPVSDINQLAKEIGLLDSATCKKKELLSNTSRFLGPRAHLDAKELEDGPRMPPYIWARAFTDETAEDVFRGTSFIAPQVAVHRDLLGIVEMIKRLIDVWASLQGTSYEIVRVNDHIDSFFIELDKLVYAKRKSPALDHIYTMLDTWMIESQSDLVTEVLRRVDVNTYDLYVLIGMLTITLDWKASLPKRSDFYKDIRDRAERERGKEQAERLLLGLE